MSGNVWEWTRSLVRPYPYVPQDGREDMQSTDPRVLRGGSFDLNQWRARCAYRNGDYPAVRSNRYGFRVAVVFPIFASGL